MSIDRYLELSFANAGIRDSEKRLKGLIMEVAVEPMKAFGGELDEDFDTVEEIVRKRVAGVIAYWAQHKHEPIRPQPNDMMSDVTNIGKKDITLSEFYQDQVKDSLYVLEPVFSISVPIAHHVVTDELEFALLLLEERMDVAEVMDIEIDADEAETSFAAEPQSSPVYQTEAFRAAAGQTAPARTEAAATPTTAAASASNGKSEGGNRRSRPWRQEQDQQQPAKVAVTQEAETVVEDEDASETGIVLTETKNIESAPPQEINVDVLSISADDAWRMVYNLMGYESDYIQQKMMPRWRDYPDTFQQDRRFLYNVFIQAIRNATGVQYVGGNHKFSGGETSLDQLWNHYFRELSAQVGPQLSVAQLAAAVDAPWYRRWWDWIRGRSKNISPMWLVALAIALVFDGLTTYVSLDQTPMDGAMVMIFTVLITALFQIADVLVINYRKREFEADALIAKYKAKVDQIAKTLEGLSPTSDSYVQLSMQKSQAAADCKAAEDNRRMARRGGFWTARIADINVVVTAYGFAFLFLNAQEPMYALYEQIQFIFVLQAWELVNFWVFLMIALAITVSFVINTAQRTEILGWSMRRLKTEA